MNTLTLIACLLSAVIRFDAVEWDFGLIEEKDGLVWHSFTAVNMSDKPVNITSVSSSCRCVSAIYPRRLIAPGEVFEFLTKLDPAGLGSKISRSLSILAGGEYTTITLKADIIPIDNGDSCRYRLSPELRADVSQLRFGYVPKGSHLSKIVRVRNVSSSDLNLQEILLPVKKHLDIDCVPVLAAGEQTDVVFTFCADPDAPFGRIDIPILELSASAIITSDLNQSPSSPKLRLYPSEFRTRRGRGSVTIFNDGLSDLVVLAIEADCEIDLKVGERIPAGKSRKISVRDAMKGSVFIVNNDPIRPYREIRIQPSN